MKNTIDFFANLSKAATGMFTGKTQTLDAREKIRRLDICKECPSDLYDAEKVKCKGCSCKGFMLKWKASVNIWNCPRGHWDELGQTSIDAPYGYCRNCKAVVEELEDFSEDKVLGICTNGCKRVIFKKDLKNPEK